MSAVVTLAVLAICWRAGYIDASTVGVLMGLWGGELGLCCLKRLVGDKTKKAETPNDERTGTI